MGLIRLPTMTCGGNRSTTQGKDILAESVYYIAVARDDAKRLFATKDPAALRALSSEWIGANSLDPAGKVLRLGNELALLLQQFGPIADEMPPPLTSMFAGSHKLVEEDDFAMKVIRPDLIVIMAQLLAKTVAEETAENQAALGPFQQFFAKAAENRDAVAIVRLATESPS